MSIIRPELAARLRPWREFMASVATGLAGAWLWSRGGLILQPVGIAIIAVAAVWGLGAWRRHRFHRAVAAPGLVEIDEGAIRYFGARVPGGEVALRDIVAIRLLRLDATPQWRIETVDGAAMLIPVEAAGASALIDAFSALPGFDLGESAAALVRGAAFRTVWKRS